MVASASSSNSQCPSAHCSAVKAAADLPITASRASAEMVASASSSNSQCPSAHCSAVKAAADLPITASRASPRPRPEPCSTLASRFYASPVRALAASPPMAGIMPRPPDGSRVKRHGLAGCGETGRQMGRGLARAHRALDGCGKAGVGLSPREPEAHGDPQLLGRRDADLAARLAPAPRLEAAKNALVDLHHRDAGPEAALVAAR